MGGLGSGTRGELIPQRHLPRLDVLELADAGVFGARVVGGRLSWPDRGLTLAFELRDDVLRLVEPITQAIRVEKMMTPTGGEYLMFRCPRCGDRRRVLHLADWIPAFGCRECLPLTYVRCNASGNRFREAAARLRSLRRGRRRPEGGQGAHEDRLKRADAEYERMLRREGERWAPVVYGDGAGLRAGFWEAKPKDWWAVLGEEVPACSGADDNSPASEEEKPREVTSTCAS